MAEKTYTFTEIVNNIRNAETEGVLARLRIDPHDASIGVTIALGYPITEEGYDQFDADLTAAGL
jgi:hypothetical protein